MSQQPTPEQNRDAQSLIQVTGEATGFIPTSDVSENPIIVIGTDSIRKTFDSLCIQQAINSRQAPGVTELVLNPDAHCGYGAPVGCVLVSPTHIYPGPVGVDIKCSMSLLQFDLPAQAIVDTKIRRALINAILERTPTGPGQGQRSVKKSRHVDETLGHQVVTQGASSTVCRLLGIPAQWANHCEDAFHVGHNNTQEALTSRLNYLIESGLFDQFGKKILQLGSYGGGNHFGECEVVEIEETLRARTIAQTFGLQDGRVAFLSHCGSRGFGYHLAQHQFKTLQHHFQKNNIPFPGEDKELVYAPLGTPQANDYLDDMALGANFATVNHLLINTLVWEAFNEVIPGVKANLVYLISHNIARQEMINNQLSWVHRKGATRAFPAGHASLENTPFFHTGHPILLPGNPQDGSAVMVANPGAELSCFSVNHGAGRALGRRQAIRTLDQRSVDESFQDKDILTNCRRYPLDEAPASYKNFKEVLQSVECAGLASPIAKLKARFVIKDEDKSLRGAA